MIRLKTAVLVGCALKMGAIIGKASEKDQMALYDFGIQLGLAFQLQDDYLDAFGNQETFGKKIGGDILEDKKTILYHLALKKATPDQRKSLQFLLGGEANLGEDQKINSVKSIFQDTGAKSDVNELIQHHANMALLQLEKLSIPTAQKNRFVALKDWLMQRTF
jgi:geranylgeranyl diphosphate synthase type II